MKFAHLADCHLGYHQYSLKQRAQDIADAWLWACDKIAQEKCDFCLLAGDLFHHRSIDPVTLHIACLGLRSMKCPIYAIKGNHEIMRSNDIDWIDYLEAEKLIDLVPSGGTFQVKQDAYRVNIYGLDWVGMATNQKVSELEILESKDFTILMLHAGLEDMLPRNHPGTVSYDVLQPLMATVDYVALGHVHKPLRAGWVFNPGSLETISSDEYQWEDRGLLITEVAADNTFETQLHIPPRREFYFLNEDYKDEIFQWSALDDSIVFLNSSNPKEALDIMAEVCNPLYIKVDKVKKETEKVQIKTFSKIDMEVEAIKQLTEIEPKKILEMKELKEGEQIWNNCHITLR